MSTAPSNGNGKQPGEHLGEIPGKNGRPLHRIATVRSQQGVSLRTASRRWNEDLSSVRRQEEETSDLTLSQLYRWQQLLDVPVAELLVDVNQSLSAPVLRRAQMLRLMKTAVTLRQKSKNVQVQRLAQMMIEQLIEIMPELSSVSPWQGSEFELGEEGPKIHPLADDIYLAD